MPSSVSAEGPFTGSCASDQNAFHAIPIKRHAALLAVKHGVQVKRHQSEQELAVTPKAAATAKVFRIAKRVSPQITLGSANERCQVRHDRFGELVRELDP